MTLFDLLDVGAQDTLDSEPVSKSAEAFKTISEVSEMLDVPQHVLRFWESKFSQIKPLKRNGGRRYYRPQDIDTLISIKHLLYKQGYTIKGARKAFDKKLAGEIRQQEELDIGAAQAPATTLDALFNLTAANQPEAEAYQGAVVPQAPLEAVADVVSSGASRARLLGIKTELEDLRDMLKAIA